MDQGPRSVFLAQAVKPEERIKVMGIVNTVKTLSQSGGPLVTGGMAQAGWFGTVFTVAGALKGSYDLLLIGLWLNLKKETAGGEEQVMQMDEYDGLVNDDSDEADEEDGPQLRNKGS